MKIKFRLQLKLLFAATLVIVVTLSVLTILAANNQRKTLQLAFRNLGVAMAQSLDANINSQADLNDVAKLQNSIYKIIWLNPDIVKITISLPNDKGLKIVASNDTTLLGSVAVPESTSVYQKGEIVTNVLTEADGTKVLSVITPVHIGGQRVGTYDIQLSLVALEETISKSQTQFLLSMAIATVAIIVVLFLLINITVISPINWLQKGMQIIGGGDLSYRIKIKSRDEMGALAEGFNEMTYKLKESRIGLETKIKEKTKQLAEAKDVLEVKVRARTKELSDLANNLDEQVKDRTKELQDRVNELERFHKLTVGRELKMLELKKQIQELKQLPESLVQETKNKKIPNPKNKK